MTGLKLIFYKLYLFFLSIWLGAGLYQALAFNQSWYDDPLAYVDHLTAYPVPGAINPIPVLTILLAVFTVFSLILLLGYHGSGKKTSFISLGGMFIVLLATYIFYVPTSGKIFEGSGSYSNDQIVSMSKSWVLLDYLRQLMVIFLYFMGLVALARFRSPRR